MKSKDFQSLIGKLARGRTIEQAAAEAGMSVEEARGYLESRTNEDDESLRSFADEALRVSLRVLKKIALEDPMMSAETTGIGNSTSWDATHMKAASELLKAGMSARRLLKEKKTIERGQDLFDKASEREVSAWTFKDPEKG